MKYEVLMSFDKGTTWWSYGIYSDLNVANEVAMQVRDERGCWINVKDVKED